jgi:5-methylcytosine-specific restriction protein A
MTVFFQHVGEAGGARDFPRTIGTVKDGLRRFHVGDLEKYLTHLPSGEIERLRQDTDKYEPQGFQVWGIPSGARSILRDFQVGDFLFLLEAAGPGGSFAYVGRTIAKPSRECFELSQHLWGEQRFPLILFLKGHLTNYRWFSFCESLGYKTNWNPAGQTYRLQHERLITSPFIDEEGLVRAVGGQTIPLEPITVAEEIPFQDDAELDFQDEEGRRILRQHLYRERSSRLVREFKSTLVDFSCRVCGFDFLRGYGELGRGFIEAHHTKPVSELEPNETVRLQDLLPVCSNCHRMLHRQYPSMDWKQLKDLVTQAFINRV